MAEIPDRFLVHRATLQGFTGAGPYGEVFGEPVAGVPCWVSNRRRLVRTETGEEVVSEATVLFKLDRRELTVPNSLITLHTEIDPAGTSTAQILSQAIHTDGGMGAWQHLEVTVG